jgi:hypothetical protein
MTIEELCDLPPDKLCALSKEELEKHLSQYFNVTRPELAPKVEKKTQQIEMPIDPKKQAMLDAMAAEGIDLSFLQRKKR